MLIKGLFFLSLGEGIPGPGHCQKWYPASRKKETYGAAHRARRINPWQQMHNIFSPTQVDEVLPELLGNSKWGSFSLNKEMVPETILWVCGLCYNSCSAVSYFSAVHASGRSGEIKEKNITRRGVGHSDRLFHSGIACLRTQLGSFWPVTLCVLTSFLSFDTYRIKVDPERIRHILVT